MHLNKTAFAGAETPPTLETRRYADPSSKTHGWEIVFVAGAVGVVGGALAIRHSQRGSVANKP